MDVYQNENPSSKYLILSTNTFSRYVSLSKIDFGCVHNMTFLNFAQAMYVILSSQLKQCLIENMSFVLINTKSYCLKRHHHNQ